MEITDLIRQEAHRYHQEKGQEPTRLYLGRQELTALKCSLTARRELFYCDGGATLKLYGVTVIPVAESSHFHLTRP